MDEQTIEKIAQIAYMTQREFIHQREGSYEGVPAWQWAEPELKAHAMDLAADILADQTQAGHTVFRAAVVAAARSFGRKSKSCLS